jgi:hypothetical protein
MKKYLFILLSLHSGFIQGQNCNGFENYPQGEAAGKAAFIEFEKLVEQLEFEKALLIWEELYSYSPTAGKFMRKPAIEMYKALIENEKKANQQEIYKEKIAAIYERNLACLYTTRQDSGRLLEMMAYDFSVIGCDDVDKTLKTYQKAVEINGDSTNAYILPYYADYVIFMYANDLISKDILKNTYKKLEAIKDANVDNSVYLKNWKYVEDYFEPILYPVGFFDCSYFEKKLLVDANEAMDKNNTEKMKEILAFLIEKDCGDSELVEKLKQAIK